MNAPTARPQAPRRPTYDDLTPVQRARYWYVQHANRCRLMADPKRCQKCRDLGDRIEIEAGRRWGWPDGEMLPTD